ncbi:MAG: M1 family peptidase, partial [Nitrospirota bacterium]|nr:M1 family peptidase [Nitrospirota bacterium]
LAGKGTARSWTLRPPDRAPVLVVAAESAEALEALRGPLPHYGRRSFLVFDGREAVVKGVWPTRDSPLSRRFD